MSQSVTIIGGGLAGCEAAWQVARREIPVRLFEMRPAGQTGAHVSGNLAELVCSNSLGSKLPDRATGLLQAELTILDSLLLKIAHEHAVPAGGALAVDRELFALKVTKTLSTNPLIEIVREEVADIPDGPTIIASGPLTSPKLSHALQKLTGTDHLYFYDAISPIVTAESIDMSKAFFASRYGRGEEGDYINCPCNKMEYEAFVAALLRAPVNPIKEFETAIAAGVKAGDSQHFEGCLPIEIIAKRGPESLRFGPMRPVGLTHPQTGQSYYAIVQLRQDNILKNLYNLVGFQTGIKWGEQEKILRLIPGLEKAEFVRLGQMHRNTFLCSPRLLRPTLQFHNRDQLFCAGQITGVEGYMGNIATGLLAGLNMARLLQNQDLLTLPQETMLGALCHYVTHCDPKHFQPMKANFGLLPPLGTPHQKLARPSLYTERSLGVMKDYLIAV